MTKHPRVAADIETNDLLPRLTTVHCLVIRDLDTRELVASVSPLSSPEEWTRATGILRDAELVVGHNFINFDARALAKVGLVSDLEALVPKIRDTMLIARILFPDVKKQLDFDLYAARLKKATRAGVALPKEDPHVKDLARIMGRQSLKAWGIRLGVAKGDYGDDAAKDVDIWAEWSPEMHSYCEQDTLVTCALWDYLEKEARSWYGPDWLDHLSIRVLHRTAHVCAQIEENGWPFDVEAATSLYGDLVQERESLTEQLVEAFGTWVEPGKEFTPTVGNSRTGNVKDAPYTKIKVVTFNPGSLHHVAKRLVDLYDWEPEEFTESGQPKLDEGVLGPLADRYPEVALLNRWLLVNKRIAQIAEGKQGWLRVVRNGRVHASYMVNGTLSGRASHREPNIAQVPSNEAEYGPECRSMFHAGPPGWIMVGADASGLELRCLAHRLAEFDQGNYARIVTQGDVHTTNQGAAGLPSRPDAKTFIYAFLYGAGDRKIGSIVKPQGRETEQTYVGRALKSKFTKRTPGLKRLLDGIKAKLEHSRYLKGLDGRRLFVRDKHAALNTDLQSAGAVICSAWLCRIDHVLRGLGLKHGWDGDYVILGWIHDEVQLSARNHDIADTIKSVCVEAIRDMADLFDFDCPLDGEAKQGRTWSETH